MWKIHDTCAGLRMDENELTSGCSYLNLQIYRAHGEDYIHVGDIVGLYHTYYAY